MKPPLIAELKARREALGWSVVQVGQRCGVDEKSLDDWERGISSPPLDAVQRWAVSLDLELGLSAAARAARPGVRIDWDMHRIAVDGTSVRLTPMEWKALERLAKIPGELVTHEALFRHLYGDDQPYRAQSTAIRVLITKLRRLLPLRIEARWGRGYVVSGIEPTTDPSADRDKTAEEAAEQPVPPPGKLRRESAPSAREAIARQCPVRESPAREPVARQLPDREPFTRELPDGEPVTREASVRELIAPDPPVRKALPSDRGCGRGLTDDGHSGPRAAALTVHASPCRAEELGVIERFLAERGVTRCPDVATIQHSPLPTLIWDKNKRKWVRPPLPGRESSAERESSAGREAS